MKFSEFKKNIDDRVKNVIDENESSERLKNLEAILNIVNTINRSLILDDVLELVLKNSIRLTNSERGFIVLQNISGDLEFKLGLNDQNENLPKQLFEVSNTVVEDVFRNGQSVFIEGAQSDATYDPSRSILKLDLQTILCSPLITDGKKIGVIYVDSKHLHKIKVREITGTIEKSQTEFESNSQLDDLLFDRLKLKSKVAADSIRNIQKYAQVLLETSVTDLNKDNNDLNRTIQSVIKYLSPLKKFSSVTFKTELNPLPLCDFDPEQIQHLLVHLITNAVDANKSATITIRSFVTSKRNCVEIQDDGPGFPEKVKANPSVVFNLSNGGYGLFLCKNIMDKNKGEIKILNSDKGALIHFLLPF